MNKTIILKDQKYLNHITRSGHPESPKRLEKIYEVLQSPDVKSRFDEVSPRKAENDEIALNHSSRYIETIKNTSGKPFVSLDPDTNTSEGSYEASLLAAGAVLKGIDMILGGDATNGFALVRPPGHHAEKSKAMGFCIFNNIAVGAHYLMKKHDYKRILIIDWDLHHGNGTQNSFYDLPEVLYFSIHQFPFYPGTGSVEETGAGKGQGFTVNVPLPGGQGDDDYAMIFRDILEPLAHEYNPQFILVSAGYDIYTLDPLGTMDVTPHGFYILTKMIKKMAEEICGGKLFLTLEGGYHVDGIAESVKHTIFALTENEHEQQDIEKSVSSQKGNSIYIMEDTIKNVKRLHSAQWDVFK